MAATESIIISTPKDVLDKMNSWYFRKLSLSILPLTLPFFSYKVRQTAWRVRVDKGLLGKSNQSGGSREYGNEGEVKS